MEANSWRFEPQHRILPAGGDEAPPFEKINCAIEVSSNNPGLSF
jgi:hypothetical protein